MMRTPSKKYFHVPGNIVKYKKVFPIFHKCQKKVIDKMERLMSPGLYNLYPGHCDMIDFIMRNSMPTDTKVTAWSKESSVHYKIKIIYNIHSPLLLKIAKLFLHALWQRYIELILQSLFELLSYFKICIEKIKCSVT